MVKSGRSKNVRGGNSKGPGTCGGGSGSTPPSPTRRLKKGGKRGRRLCHMDGCTLCPSFGFEGEVAVSCSHHKSPGMRNLTARRCQHEGCFTVANFGMPGDKPGYCAAHSTTGMVNRNKPRGAEGMLAGVPIARSSRRAAKANTVLQGLRLAGHTRGAASGGAAADSATTRASFNRTHYSTSLGSEPSSGSGLASAGTEDGDDCEGYRLAAAPARMLSTSWTSNGLPHESYREESDEGDPYSDGNSRGTTDGGKVKGNSARVRMTSITGAPQSGSGSGSGVSFMPFISRGEDPPESDIGPRSSVNGNQRRVDVPKGVGAGRVRARGGSAAAAAATQEAYLAVHRVGLKAAQMGQAVDNIMLGESVLRDGTSRTGIAAGFPGHARGGQGGDASKDIESLRAYLIDSTDMDSSLDGSLGMGINSGMELLGNDGSLVPGKMSGAGHDMVATSRGMDLASALRRSQAMRCRSGSASGLSMGASACRGSGTNVQPGGAIGCQHDGGVLSDDDDGEDFGGLVNLQGLSPLGLAGLNTSAMTEGPTRAAACTPVSDSAYAAVSMGLATPGVSSSRAASAALSSSLRVGFVSTLASSGTPTSSVFAVCHNSASTSPQHAPASVSAPLPAAVVLQGDDGWWDVLEGEEFVAMPEPLWGVGPTSQGLDDEPAARGQEDPRSWRGGGAAGSFPMSTRGNGGATLPDPLDGGDSNLCSEKDGKDSLQAILLDQTDRLKPRTLLSSSPSIIGDGVDVSDEGFVTIEDSKAKANRGTGGAVGPPGFPMLSGGSRLANGRDDLGDIGGVRLRPRYPNGDTDTLSPGFNAGSSLRHVKRESGSNSLFLSSAPNGPYSPPPASFGLTFGPGGSSALAGQSQLLNSSAPFSVGSGAGGGSMGMKSGMAVHGGNANRIWGSGDPISPSKFLSASPSKRLSASPSKTVLPPQSSSPWRSGGICPPHQTQAAGRA